MSDAGCWDASERVFDTASRWVDESGLVVRGGLCFGEGCTGRNLAGIEVDKTGGEIVRGEGVNGAAGCKGYALVVAVDLGDAWN